MVAIFEVFNMVINKEAKQKDVFGSGKYYYFRDHDSEAGWGINFSNTNKVIATVCDKNYAGLIADLLNKYGHNYDLLTSLEEELLANNKGE